MNIRKISKCFDGGSTQYIVQGTLDAIVAVFFRDRDGLVYKIHYLTPYPSDHREILEAIKRYVA